MGGSGKRGGADRVIESRHLVGLFLGIVLLCGVFFTLGYVMGRTQFSAPVQAADKLLRLMPPAAASPKPKETQPPPGVATEWDFYTKKESPAPPVAKPAAPAPAAVPATEKKPAGAAPAANPKPAVATTKPPARYQPPKLAKGAIVLQVSALSHQNDALRIADAIQEKQFPAYVVTPASDNLYHVQVGPYPDEKSAEAAKRALEQLGFKPIIKR